MQTCTNQRKLQVCNVHTLLYHGQLFLFVNISMDHKFLASQYSVVWICYPLFNQNPNDKHGDCLKKFLLLRIKPHHFTPTRMAIIKKIIASVGKDVEKLETLYTAGGYVKWGSFFRNLFDRTQNVKHRVTILPSNYTPRYLHKKIECAQKNLYTTVHCSIIHNNQKVEPTQMSIN